MSGPLEGVKVLDLTSVLLGPYATQIMGDLGADVIKIESPAGDTTRQTGVKRHDNMASFFMITNRNKRSLVLDLKREAAKEALWKLIDTADVFIHAIRPKSIKRLGFGPDEVLARNPRIVYAGVHGFKEDGPYGNRPAYDDIIQSGSGLSALMTEYVGRPMHTPMVTADKTCGLTTAYAIMAALFHRERTGKGQAVEIPMLEVMTSFMLMDHAHGAIFDPPEAPYGYPRVMAKDRRPHETSDGKYITLLAYTDAQWTRLFGAVGREELLQDPRFRDLSARTANAQELYAVAAEIIKLKPLAEWLALAEEAELPHMPVNRFEDLESDPHLAATGFFEKHQHPTEGGMTYPAIPTYYSETPGTIRSLPPNLGEHSAEILREAGLSEAEMAEALK